MQPSSSSVLPAAFEEASQIVVRRLGAAGMQVVHSELLGDATGPVKIWVAHPVNRPPTAIGGIVPTGLPSYLFVRLGHQAQDRRSLLVWGSDISALITNPQVSGEPVVHRRPAPRRRVRA